MRVLLINVCIRYDTNVKYIPVGLSCIATSLNLAGFHPDILDIDLYRYTDEEIEDFLQKNNFYDVVGMGNIVTGYKYIKKLAIQVKRAMPETVLIVGNTVATSIPELLLRYVPQVNIAVIGEGDRTVVDIVRAVSEGKSWNAVPGIAYRSGEEVIFTPKREAIPKIDNIPFPDYSLFDIEKYISVSKLTVPEPLPPVPLENLKALPISTARGCPFSCTFCSHAFKQYKYRFYNFEAVVNHIKYLQEKYGINYIHFWDELTIFSRNRLRELCDSIEKAKISFYWSINSRPNTFTQQDLELLKRSQRLGSLTVGGALESADPGILKAMNKHMKVEQYIEHVQVAKEAGLQVKTSLVFGYPQETEQTIKKTIDLCRYLGIYPSAGFLLPLPNTLMYEYAIKRGLIKDEEGYLLSIGDRQDLHVNLTEMPDDVFFNTVKDELIMLKNDLNIPIPDDKVIKTGGYKVARTK